jgi:hypothetical protein
MFDRAVLVTAAAAMAAFFTPTSAQMPAMRGSREIATSVLGTLPQVPLFWHLVTYPDRTAAEAARDKSRGTVVESFGKVWLFTIAQNDWHSSSGTLVAKIGPLPFAKAASVTATYLEGESAPGFQTAIHQHAGPEAIYMLSGEICVETPDGHVLARAGGDPLVVRGDLPMRLTHSGAGARRSLVLVIHDSAQPWMVPANNWNPAGLCQR